MYKHLRLSDFIATIALLISALNAALWWKSLKTQASQSEPTIDFQASEAREAPGWLNVQLQIVNHSKHPLKGKTATVVRPLGAGIIGFSDIPSKGDKPWASEKDYSKLPNDPAKTIELHISVAPKGSWSENFMSDRDKNYEWLMVRWPQSSKWRLWRRSSKLSIRFKISEMSDSEREIIRTVTRIPKLAESTLAK